MQNNINVILPLEDLELSIDVALSTQNPHLRSSAHEAEIKIRGRKLS